jgi:hypothetical protein
LGFTNVKHRTDPHRRPWGSISPRTDGEAGRRHQ